MTGLMVWHSREILVLRFECTFANIFVNENVMKIMLNCGPLISKCHPTRKPAFWYPSVNGCVNWAHLKHKTTLEDDKCGFRAPRTWSCKVNYIFAWSYTKICQTCGRSWPGPSLHSLFDHKINSNHATTSKYPLVLIVCHSNPPQFKVKSSENEWQCVHPNFYRGKASI